jgi:hypothetical protein
MPSYSIHLAAAAELLMPPKSELQTMEAESAEEAVAKLVLSAPANEQPNHYWARVVLPAAVLPVQVDGRHVASVLAWRETKSATLDIAGQPVVVDAGPLVMRSTRAIADACVWNEREVDVGRFDSQRFVIKPRRKFVVYLGLFVAVFVALALVVYALRESPSAGGVRMAISAFCVPPFLYFLWLYCSIPRWRFCRETDRLIYRRLFTRLVLPLDALVGIQLCCGGLKIVPRVYESFETSRRGSRFCRQVKLLPTFQLNAILSGGQERLPITEQFDFAWTHRTSSDLATFLNVPLLNTCGERHCAAKQ